MHCLNATSDDLRANLVSIAPYRVVVILDEIVAVPTRERIAKLLCQTGCRYMMAWGDECSRWDDAVDFASRQRFDHGEVPERDDIMTTWHADETLDEVFWFAKNCACFDGFELGEGETVLLWFGKAELGLDYSRRYAEA